MSSSKDFVNYVEAIKKLALFSFQNCSVNVSTSYAERWYNIQQIVKGIFK